MRARDETPPLIVKRDFGFTLSRCRQRAENRNRLRVLFASANRLVRARPSPERATARRSSARERPERANERLDQRSPGRSAVGSCHYRPCPQRTPR